MIHIIYIYFILNALATGYAMSDDRMTWKECMLSILIYGLFGAVIWVIGLAIEGSIAFWEWANRWLHLNFWIRYWKRQYECIPKYQLNNMEAMLKEYGSKEKKTWRDKYALYVLGLMKKQFKTIKK